MFDLLGASDGMALTESLAMTPAASVSGFVLSHPDSTYFNVEQISETSCMIWRSADERAEDLALIG
jgi:5-methyltetrahydrofolate--homocysteine methyltransferase